MLAILTISLSTKIFGQDLNLVWEPVTDINDQLFPSIQVFKTNTPLPGGSELNAQYVLVNLADQNIRLKAVQGNGTNRTPLDFAQREEDKVFAAINAGFFGGTSSFSLVLEEGQVLSTNIKAVSRTFEGAATTYYPTRGAFGILNDGQADVAWIYNVGIANTTYAYPIPSPNALNTAPQPQPSESFPEGGTIWDVATAIGGSPVLVENGQIRVTDGEELIDVNNGNREPRTAIGYTADNEAILMVIDGRAPGFSLGATLPEVAQMMKELGAVEAMNLDGGGSSAMIVNDEVINRPSDATGMRPVPSVLLLTLKTLIFDTEDPDRYTEINGSWTETANNGFYGSSKARFKEAGTGESYAAYNFQALQPALYEVAAWWVPSSNRSKETPYVISKSGLDNDTVRVDQSSALSGDQFNVLGSFHLGPADSLFVSDLVSDGGLVTVDAIELRKVGESEPIVTLSDGNMGDHVRGSTLAFDVNINSPNSGVKLEQLQIFVTKDDGIRAELSVESLDQVLSFTKAFSYELIDEDEQLTFEFEITDDRGITVKEIYEATLQSFQVAIDPDMLLKVESLDTARYTVSAGLLEGTTGALSALRIFKSVDQSEEVLIEGPIALSGTDDTVDFEYIVTDRASQEVVLRFEVETDDGQKTSKPAVIETLPTKGDVRIAVISDLNGSFGSVTYENRIIELIDRMPTYNPDLVICGGDIIAGQSTALSASDVDAMWAGFDEFIGAPLREMDIPFAFTLGNHDAAIDVDIAAAERYWNTPGHFPGYFPVDTAHYPFYQSFLEKENGELFMVSWNANDATISQEELSWVRSQLESTTAQNAKYRFIIGHLPLYDVATERNSEGNVLKNADSLLQMMQDLDVHTYFSGHHHVYYPARRGQVELLNAGAAGPGARVLIGTESEPISSFTLVDVFTDQDTLIYNTFEMPVDLPERLELVEEQTLPEIVNGFSGFVVRRDVPGIQDASGNLSSQHLSALVESEAEGSVSATQLGNNVVRISGAFANLEGELIEDFLALAIYQGQHDETGEPLFFPEVTTNDGKSGTFEIEVPFTDAQQDLLSVGALYVLIKTSSYPQGELRSQIYPERNTAPFPTRIISQQGTDTLLVRDTQGVFSVEWDPAKDAESNPVTYYYELSLDESFSEVLVSASVGKANAYNLLTEGALVGFLDQQASGDIKGTFYQRVTASDGKHVTVGETSQFNVKVTEEPLDGPVQIVSPDYIFNPAFNVTTTASNGHGVTVDLNGRVWHGSFGSGRGFQVSNPDGTAYTLSSNALTYSGAGVPAVTSFDFNGSNVSVSSIRGLGLDEEGHVLVVISNSDIYRFHPDTGEPEAKWDGPTSLTNPTVDDNGRVFVASVVGNRQFILERNGTEYNVVVGSDDNDLDGQPDGFELSGRELARSSAISKNGKWIIVPANSGRNIHVFSSADGVQFEPFQVIESISQAGTNSIIAGSGAQFWYLANRAAISPILTYRDFENDLFWSKALEEIVSTDQRGLAFSSDLRNLYTVSSVDGSVINYELRGAGGGLGSIPTFPVDEVTGRDEEGQALLQGLYARVLGVVNSQNFSEKGLDISMESNDRGISVFSPQLLLSGLVPGDSIAAVGRIEQNLGLVRVATDSVRLIQENSRVVDVRPVESLQESHESLRVSLNDASLADPADWNSSMAGALGFEVALKLKESDFTTFVDRQSSLFGASAPTENFKIEGVIRRTRSGDLALFAESLGPVDILGQSSPANDILVFPNPVSDSQGGILTIRSMFFRDKNPEIRMTDLQGKNVSMSIDLEGEDYLIDLSGLRRGMYFIHVLWDGGKVTRPIIR